MAVGLKTPTVFREKQVGSEEQQSIRTHESVGGVEWYVVEHETSRDPMKVAKQCLDNLHAMGK